jgi:hypothetical protein
MPLTPSDSSRKFPLPRALDQNGPPQHLLATATQPACNRGHARAGPADAGTTPPVSFDRSRQVPLAGIWSERILPYVAEPFAHKALRKPQQECEERGARQHSLREEPWSEPAQVVPPVRCRFHHLSSTVLSFGARSAGGRNCRPSHRGKVKGGWISRPARPSDG